MTTCCPWLLTIYIYSKFSFSKQIPGKVNINVQNNKTFKKFLTLASEYNLLSILNLPWFHNLQPWEWLVRQLSGLDHNYFSSEFPWIAVSNSIKSWISCLGSWIEHAEDITVTMKGNQISMYSSDYSKQPKGELSGIYGLNGPSAETCWKTSIGWCYICWFIFPRINEHLPCVSW